MSNRSFKTVIAVALLSITLDRASKLWALSQLADGHVQVVFPGWLQFALVHNPGAAYGFLTNATWVFTIISTSVVVAILRFAPRIQHLGWAAAVGGILGGAAGNLIDRLINEPGFAVGHVTDFIQVPAIPPFQTFNIADASIFVAVIALMIMSIQGFRIDGSRDIENSKINQNNESNLTND